MLIQTPPAPYSICIILFGLFFVLNHLLPHATHTFHRSQDKEVTHAYERTWEIGGVDLFFLPLSVVLQKVIKKKNIASLPTATNKQLNA